MIVDSDGIMKQESGGGGRELGFRLTGRLVVGLLVVAVGIAFLLDNLDIADASDFLRFWPALTLAYGLAMLTGLLCRRQVPGGLLLTIFSGWLLLQRLAIVERGPWEFWPIALVVLGASMIYWTIRGPASAAALEKGASSLHAFALWSGSTRKVVSEDFRGGEVTAIMGGHEIDFRPAKMAGGTAVIDLFVWWGGVEIKVPEDWKVTNEALALLGGVVDKSRAPAGEVKGHLILRGPVIMGGVEVKN